MNQHEPLLPSQLVTRHVLLPRVSMDGRLHRYSNMNQVEHLSSAKVQHHEPTSTRAPLRAGDEAPIGTLGQHEGSPIQVRQHEQTPTRASFAGGDGTPTVTPG